MVEMLQQILDKYRDWPSGQALPVISRQQTGTLIKQMLREAGIDAPYCGCATRAPSSTKPACPSGRLPLPTRPATPTARCWPR